MRTLTKKLWAPILLAAICLPVAQAQTQQQPPTGPTQPIPPLSPAAGQANGQSGSAGQKSDQEPASPVATPTQTITGAFSQTVGGSDEMVSRILAGLNVSELFTTNVGNSSTNPIADGVTNIGGYFDLSRIRQNSDLSFRYAGGGSFYARSTTLDNTYDQFEVSQTVQFRRWKLRLDDLFSYLNQSPFGFGGGGPTGTSLLPGVNQSPTLAPGQTIFSTGARRLLNSAVGEVDVDLSPRSAWTATGIFGYLHYLDPGFLDYYIGTFSTGYNYSFTSRDTLGVRYDFSAIRYNPQSGSIDNNSVLFTYGHHLNQELSLVGGVGPGFSGYTAPGTTVSKSYMVINAEGSLVYQYKGTGLSASFFRGVTGGSGIVVGTISNVISVGVTRQFSRFWVARASGGTSFNQSLPQVSPVNSKFVSSFVLVGVTRQLGPRASFYVNYELLRQTVGSQNVCAAGVCPPSFLTHQVWVGFSWTMRPIGLN